MDTITIAMIAIGLSTNIISFLFGMLAGRDTAYKTVKALKTADLIDLPDARALAEKYRSYKTTLKRDGPAQASQ